MVKEDPVGWLHIRAWFHVLGSKPPGPPKSPYELSITPLEKSNKKLVGLYPFELSSLVKTATSLTMCSPPRSTVQVTQFYSASSFDRFIVFVADW